MSVLEKGEVRLLRANTLHLIQTLSIFTESLDSEEVKTFAIISIVASGVIGLVSVVIDGSTTCVSVDLLMGVVLGSLMAKHVVEHTYDAYYDRFSTAVIFIGESAAAGIIGGVIGGAIHNYAIAENTAGQVLLVLKVLLLVLLVIILFGVSVLVVIMV